MAIENGHGHRYTGDQALIQTSGGIIFYGINSLATALSNSQSLPFIAAKRVR